MNVRLDASRVGPSYTQAFQLLKTLPGFDQQAVLRAEMGSILKTWAGRVPVVTNAEADLNSRLHVLRKLYLTTAGASSGYVSINAGLRGSAPAGTTWFRTPRNKFVMAGLVYPDGSSVGWNPYRHFSPASWTAILQAGVNYTDAIGAALAKGRGSIGIARQSVIQIADQLGIDLTKVQGAGISDAGIAKARAAIASSGRAFQNGSGSQGSNETTAYVEALNRLPYAPAIGMDVSLLSVVNGRANYIVTSYQKGAFTSLAKATAAFPNILSASGLN